MVFTTLKIAIAALVIEKWDINFWISYTLGLGLLIIGYFLHQYIMKHVLG